MYEDGTGLAGKDVCRSAVDGQQHVRVAVHDHEAAEIRDRSFEAGVLVAAHDHRIEAVARGCLADEPVPPLDLVLRKARV